MSRRIGASPQGRSAVELRTSVREADQSEGIRNMRLFQRRIHHSCPQVVFIYLCIYLFILSHTFFFFFPSCFLNLYSFLCYNFPAHFIFIYSVQALVNIIMSFNGHTHTYPPIPPGSLFYRSYSELLNSSPVCELERPQKANQAWVSVWALVLCFEPAVF